MSGVSGPLIVCTNLSKSYSDGTREIQAIRDLSCEIHAGEMTAVVGPSGSGKTTLLHLLGAIEQPNSGSVVFGQTDLARLSSSELTSFRAGQVSFVFADLNLLPVLTAYENVTLGLELMELAAHEVHHRATEALSQVGLEEMTHRLPAALSSGERQRVAIARALARGCSLVIADEPTAHLDHELALETAQFLKDLAVDRGAAVVLATHDHAVAGLAHRSLELEDGRLTD